MEARREDTSEPDDRTRFLATMSHDLRTPLTALRGALGLLEKKQLPPELVDQMIVMLRKSSDRLERLALGLIAIDLIDNGSTSMLAEVADLRELVTDAATMTRRLHPAIEIDAPSEPIEVACDRERVVQALDHILDNARKFGGPGGTIKVVVAREGDRGVVRISDDGPGVPIEERERIFERYVQLGERLPNEPRGAGVGLYLARYNAESMGGTASVVDDGPGATVQLSLPLALPPA